MEVKLKPFKFLSPLMIQALKRLILAKSGKKGIIIIDHNHRNILDVSNRIRLVRDANMYEVDDERGLAAKGYII